MELVDRTWEKLPCTINHWPPIVGYRNVWCRVLKISSCAPRRQIPTYLCCLHPGKQPFSSSLSFPSPFPSSLPLKHTQSWKVLTPAHTGLTGQKVESTWLPKDQSYQMSVIGYSNHTSEKELGRTLGKTRNAPTNHCVTSCKRASPLRSGTTFLHAVSINIERPLPDPGLGKSHLRVPV